MKKYEEFLNEENPKIRIVTTMGDMELELFPSVAPITVKNFLKLVDEKFYTNIIFHRVIKNFMIQGGDPLGTGYGGAADKIKGEFQANGVANPLMHTKGVISMARSMDPNSASSQFFIMHKDAPHLDGEYAAFGVVTKGLEVVDAIAEVKTNYSDKPLDDVVIKEIVII